ncbi:hypothetical protein [Paenibacillus montanisoli]|uniref:Uncharacterized protein n=1 Tax=Paenibacillus montanisoli TaxID=2081970 RepID=A0A328U003_9BACL|nr:hypothetical protein [Paenibacillus montanisoli]RAP76019.1 hypothetical protein DL346_11375 [Paenibacillus montanisoli]
MDHILLVTGFFILIVTFFATEKSLHLLELIFGWLLVVILHDAYFTLVSLNLKMVVPSMRLSDFFVRIFAHKFITPTIVVWAVDLMNSSRLARHKWSWYLFFTALLILLNMMLRRLDILKDASIWEPWVTFSKAPLLIAAAWLAMLAYRRVLGKDGALHEFR